MAAEPGVPCWSLDAERVRDLLFLLDERLKRRGVAASVYVGGVAVALRAQPRRLTVDVDAMVSNQAVLEEAEAMAVEKGLPPGWLNTGRAAGFRTRP